MVHTDEALLKICESQNIGLLFAFGSQARGDARPESDLDLAVLPRETPLFERLPLSQDRLYQGLARWSGTGNLDISWLPQASWLLWAEVARDGKLLFESTRGRADEFRIEAALRAAESFPWRLRSRHFVGRFLEGNSGVNTHLVQQKLAMMAQYVDELRPILDCSEERFLDQPFVHHGTERLMELIVECAGYINSEVSQSVKGIPPSDYYSSFFSIAAAGWVDRKTAEALADWARVRNALVHRYEDVSLPELLTAVKKAHHLWVDYVRQIQAGLDKVD